METIKTILITIAILVIPLVLITVSYVAIFIIVPIVIWYVVKLFREVSRDNTTL